MVGQLLNSREEPCPFWLKYFLRAEFFVPCSCSSVEFERNFFCFDCAQELCPQCAHTQHHILQIWRSSHQNVVRIDDAKDYLDMTAIQPYVINGSKVVFVRERPQSRVTPSSNPCSTCGRDLSHDFRFCSIECKYEWVKCGDTCFSLDPRQDVCCSSNSHLIRSKKRKHEAQVEENDIVATTSPIFKKKRSPTRRNPKGEQALAALASSLLDCKMLPQLTEVSMKKRKHEGLCEMLPNLTEVNMKKRKHEEGCSETTAPVLRKKRKDTTSPVLRKKGKGKACKQEQDCKTAWDLEEPCCFFDLLATLCATIVDMSEAPGEDFSNADRVLLNLLL